MMLSEITIRNLRNITGQSFIPVTGINLLVGPNGAGKTSVLEAIHLLGLGRTFRSRALKNAIQFDKQQLQVVAKTVQNKMPIGLQYSAEAGLEIRFNNAPLKKLSDLAAQLPLQLIPANSHQFFEQGPRFRRQLLDWGLFHVEPSFNFHWQSYKKVLQQRNASIRQRKNFKEIQLWDQHLIEHGNQLTDLRKKRLDTILKQFEFYFKLVCPQFENSKLSLKYKTGWSREITFEESIKLNLERDYQLGYTRSGAHAADWSFKIDEYEAKDVFSRGQQKLFFLALSMAQIKSSEDSNKPKGILLIDDLSSELDEIHLEIVLRQLNTMPVQIFISSTDESLVDLVNKIENNYALFHVKQGQIISKQN